VTRLIQLYIVGVFVSFNLSQLGMIRHWTRLLKTETDPVERRRMFRSRAINTFGLGMTAVVLIVVLLTKFLAGAWIAILAMGTFFLIMRGIRRHYEEVARAAGDVPVILYNIPSRTAVNLPPDFLAELGQIDGIEAVKQANGDELDPIDGLALLAGNDADLARALDLGGAGGICVASHVVGPEMRRMFDEPDRRAEIDAQLRDVFSTLFITASPAPTKAALNLLGHDVGGLRLPLVETDEAETAAVRDVLASHGLLEGAPAR